MAWIDPHPDMIIELFIRWNEATAVERASDVSTLVLNAIADEYVQSPEVRATFPDLHVFALYRIHVAKRVLAFGGEALPSGPTRARLN